MEKLRWDKQYCLEKLQQWRVLLAQPLDPVNLGCFRICFGILMVMYVYQYRSPALVNAIYLSCDFHFTYPLFDFLGLPLPTAAGLSVLLKVMGASALMVALGLLTRLSAAVFFSAFGYLFLLEKSQYNNHYYLILLLSIFFVITGANRFLSLDAWIFRKHRKNYVPQWHLFLFQIQVAMVYFFGGIAKLNTDWISGRVTQNIFSGASDGFFFVTATAGIIIDLCVGVMLMIKPLRFLGIILSLLFNLFVKYYLNVGVFPYLMSASILLFLEPDDIRNFLGLFREKKDRVIYQRPSLPEAGLVGKGVWIFICLYLAIQMLVPLRHFLYKGPVIWTLNGDRFAWRMFSQDNLGHIDFFVTDVITGDTKEVPRLKGITVASYNQMAFHPDMIIQYAKYLHDFYQKQGIYDPIITANSLVSLNGRPFSLFMNSDLNLAHPAIHINTKDLIYAIPLKSTTTMVGPKNVGKFFSPAYQLAVIEEKNLIPGDHPMVAAMQERIDRLIGSDFISPYEISDLVVELQQVLYTEYGHYFSVKQILDKLIEKNDPFDMIPSVDKMVKYFI